MKKLAFFFLMMLLPMVASADAVEIDGIYYNLVAKNKIAEVTSMPSGKYTGSIIIPDTVKYDNVVYTVETIKEKAFNGCTRMTSITIPKSVTSIESYAFSGCTGLTSVHIRDLKAWCLISFYDFASNPLYYAHHLFLNNKEIKDLIIPNTVTSIGKNAFTGCNTLLTVSIPNSVTTIGDWAFQNCSGLTSVTIPNSITTIGIGTFKNCSSLTSVTIPNSVELIKVDAFYGCI